MKVLKFTLVLIFLLVAFSVAKYLLFAHNRALPVRLPAVDTVILGDSHARHALNPEYLDRSLNLSQDSQNLIYSYYVLQKLIADGNRFRNVILTYSYHSQGEYYLDLEAMEMLRRYHIILDADFYLNLAAAGRQTTSMRTRFYADQYYLPLGISNDLYEWTQLRSGKLHSFPYLGSFEQNPKPRLKLPITLKDSTNASVEVQRRQNRNRNYLLETLKRHYFNPRGAQISPLFSLYLEKLAVLCQEHSITLYLVNTPLHPEYRKRIPTEVVNYTDSTATAMESKYHCIYLNYADFPLEDKLYYDYDHLTTPGSKVFSQQLNRIINFINTGEFSYTR